MTTDTDLIRENNQEGLQVGDFKVGDRVRVIAPGSQMLGRSAVVVDPASRVGNTVGVYIEFDDIDYGGTYIPENLELVTTTAPDVVSHPPHYTDGTPPGVEVIDIIRAHMKAGGTWETANALKYILRHPLKDNPKQDIAKASQYLSMWTKEQEAA